VTCTGATQPGSEHARGTVILREIKYEGRKTDWDFASSSFWNCGYFGRNCAGRGAAGLRGQIGSEPADVGTCGWPWRLVGRASSRREM